MANSKVQLSDGTVLLDLTGDTVTPETLLSGVIAHDAAGDRINGAVAPVRYDVAQSLTDAQKAQARNNISAMQGIESTDYPGCNYVLNGSTVEWITPPMQLGVEYRTTERYLGKPVYVKVVDCGKFPTPGTSKLVAHGISNCTPITITAQMSNTNTVPYIGYHTIGADAASITLASVSGVSDLSAYNTVALMRYIKTTD